MFISEKSLEKVHTLHDMRLNFVDALYNVHYGQYSDGYAFLLGLSDGGGAQHDHPVLLLHFCLESLMVMVPSMVTQICQHVSVRAFMFCCEECEKKVSRRNTLETIIRKYSVHKG